MPANRDANAPTRDYVDAPAARQESCCDELASAMRPALHSAPPVPESMTAHLARLRLAFPAFSFSIRPGWRGLAFEAWREAATGGLYAVITNDARELWRELEQC